MKPVVRCVCVPLIGVLLVALIAGCGGDDIIKSPGPQPKPAAGQTPAPQASQSAAAASLANLPPLPKREFQERDFAEADNNRDPFRSFLGDLMAQGRTRVSVQRKVLVFRYALEELKLVGIVQGAPSRALLIDPTGLGWIAKAGDFVGKPELVHSGGPSGTDVPINWRVDRIRAADVVFVREDPSHPEIPATTRVLALRTVEEDSRAAAMSTSSLQ